jgi:hypothetical protein
MVNGESGIGTRESKKDQCQFIKTYNMKLLFTLLLICISTQLFAQMVNVDSVVERPVRGTVGWHLMKKKNEKTAAFLLLSGGAIVSIVSLNSSLNFNWIQTAEERRAERAAYTRAWIGLGLMVSSVPFFISARSHKEKARFMLKKEKALLPDPVKQISFMAVGISLRL